VSRDAVDDRQAAIACEPLREAPVLALAQSVWYRPRRGGRGGIFLCRAGKGIVCQRHSGISGACGKKSWPCCDVELSEHEP